MSPVKVWVEGPRAADSVVRTSMGAKIAVLVAVELTGQRRPLRRFVRMRVRNLRPWRRCFMPGPVAT